MRIAMLWTFVVTLLSSVGCVTAVDDGCTSDSQCYLGRICVDGRCTGDVEFSENNDNNGGDNAENNGENSDLNNGANNANNDENSEFNSVENNEVNNVANNMNNSGNNDERVCEVADDCENGRVCTSAEAGVEERQCVQPWRCEASFEFDDFVCFGDFICNNEQSMPFRQIVCEFGDEDEGFCFCFSEPSGMVYEFEVDRLACEPDVIMDLANTNCGWRVSDGGF